MLTKQEIFDKSISGVITQGELAVDANGTCRYYVYPSGNRCAIGHLLHEDVARIWEFHNYTSICAEQSSIRLNKMLIDLDKSGISCVDVGFLEEIQNLHDVSYDMSQFRQRAIKFAERHGLTVDNINL